MAKKRKSLGPKLRFEVFKRDSFTCQYCGEKAPDVILRLDHIEPVAGGGTDDLLNLITACFGCNAGKGMRKLDDKSELEKQRRQLEELNERRVQLEMMLAWRRELYGLQELTANALVQRIRELAPDWTPAPSGVALLNKWLREYGLAELLDAAEASAQTYLRWDDAKVTQESWGKFFDMIPRVAATRRAEKDEPYLRDLLYIRAILRNNTDWHWRARRDCMLLLKGAIAAGVAVDGLRDLAKESDSYDEFEKNVEGWIRKARGSK
jgi:hypothetical protein